VSFINFVSELGMRNKGIEFNELVHVPFSERIIKAMILKNPDNVPNLYDVLGSPKYSENRDEIHFREFKAFLVDYDFFDEGIQDEAIDEEIDNFLDYIAKEKDKDIWFLDDVISGIRKFQLKSKE
jgi:hypothetical protein